MNKSFKEYREKQKKWANTYKSVYKSSENSLQDKAKKEQQVSNFVSDLTDTQKEIAKKYILQKKARENYFDYVRYCYPEYIMTPFHKFLCAIMDNVVKRVEKANSPNATLEDKKNGRIRLLISVPPQHGKLIANETPVLTKNGWKMHGDLKIGDEVINHYGKFVKVKNVFPKFFANKKVILTNNEEILCHENHEWLVYDRTKHCERVVETKELALNLTSGGNERKRGHRYNFMLPNKSFVLGEHKELKVNPYVLGVWLGDGKRDDSTICGCDNDIIVLNECRKFYPNGATWKHKTTNVNYCCMNGLITDLKSIGLGNGKKYIPSDYLTADINQRLELLAGLLDTDGYLDKKHNRFVFTTADKYLKDTFVSLVSTFGWRCTECLCKPKMSSSGTQGKKEYWQIGFNPTITIPCRIERKIITQFSKQRRIAIKEIADIEHLEGNCIEVEGGIYLVGRALVPTHNSETITKTMPSWYVGRNPTKNAILCAYNSEMAEKFEDSNRQKTREYGKSIFNVEISDTQDNKTLYQTKQGGGVMGVGIQAGITGNGGEVIIIDDPYKNSVEANSPSTRKTIWDIYQDSIQTRLRGNGNALIVIQTRWHEEDLCGVLSKMDGWVVINIPCVCENEEKDPLGRKLGQTLCPELGFDTLWAEEKQVAVGKKVWEALYQGHPTIDGGELFARKDIKFYDKNDLPTNFEEEVISCDLSFGGTQKSNDPCSIQVWGRVGANHYLLKRINKRMNFNDMCEMIRQISYNYPNARKKIVEKKANGQAVIDSLNSVIGGFVAFDPKMESKISRANAVLPFFESGNVFLPSSEIDNTIENMVEEMLKFPNGAHDDDVDAMTQYLINSDNRSGGRVLTDGYYSVLSKAFRGLKV